MSSRGTAGVGVAAAAVGAALVVAGAFLAPERTAFAWHAAFLYAWTLAIGLLGWILVHHLTNSSWFIVLRRVAELGLAPLLLLALLFLPVVGALDLLFPWVEPEAIASHHVREAVQKVRAYLNVPFFLVRAGLFFAVWLGVAGLLVRGSRGQDRGDGAALAGRQRIVAAVAVIPFGLAVHFAAIDWIVSLEPAWTSSVFPVYVFAGSLVGGLSVLILAAAGLARAGALEGVVGVSHFHGLGKLLFTLVCFWAYIGYFQFFIVWIGDEPSEVAWFLPRTHGAWRPLAVALAIGHFAMPFFALLSRPLKRSPAALSAVAGWMLLWHAADVVWMVMPAHAPEDATPHWVDLGAFLAVGGATLAFALWRARGVPVTARGDPRFEDSVGFETR